MSQILDIDDVSVDLDGHQILTSVSLSLAPSSIAALIGPNGSGKSTLLSTIAGLIATRSGRVEIGGHPVCEQTMDARRQLGFMVAQERLPALLTPRQCLRLFAESRGLADIPDATRQQAEDFGLAPWIDRALEQCSLGTRQKLSVLLALIDNPPLILLDEPLNGFDPVAAAALKTCLVRLKERHGCTVLMATHDLSMVASLANHVLVLLQGRLAIDWGPEQIAHQQTENTVDLEHQLVQALKVQQGTA